jgi:hypothetical protein
MLKIVNGGGFWLLLEKPRLDLAGFHIPKSDLRIHLVGLASSPIIAKYHHSVA